MGGRGLLWVVRRGNGRWGTYEVVWEGRDLLDAADNHIVDALLLALLEERVVHLACASSKSR